MFEVKIEKLYVNYISYIMFTDYVPYLLARNILC